MQEAKRKLSGRAQLEAFLKRLRTDRNVSDDEITEMVGRIHLNLSGLPDARWVDPKGPNGATMQEIFGEIAKFAKRRRLRPFANGPLSFVASYPRSGNTMVLSSLAKLGGVQTFTDEVATPRYCPFVYYPADYPLKRVVKSHRVVAWDPVCRYVYIVRDGRDILPSIAYMQRFQPIHEVPDVSFPRKVINFVRRGFRPAGRKPAFHKFTRKEELADFIHWLRKEYVYGDWIDFHRKLEPLREKENVLVVRYPDLLENTGEFLRIAEFLGIDCDRDELVAAFESKDEILERLAGSSANEKWGIGEEFEEGSLYHAWSQNRSGSNWRESMDARARKTYHELGATKYLLDYGFETDPDWWR